METPEDDVQDDPNIPTDTDKVLASAEVQLGGFDPYATGRALGMSERAIKFGIALLTGATKTAAAKLAGFPGEGSYLRSSASKAARTRAMQAFLKAAADHKAGAQDTPLTEPEKLRILAKGARGSNPNIQIRATLAHHEIERDIHQSQTGDVTPEDALMAIAAVSPFIAAELAAANNLTLKNLPADVAASAAAHVEQIAKNWIRDNADEAMSYARHFAQQKPTHPTNGHANHGPTA